MFRKALFAAMLALALVSASAVSASAAPVDAVMGFWQSILSVFQVQDTIDDTSADTNRLVEEEAGGLDNDGPGGPDNDGGGAGDQNQHPTRK